MNWLTGGSQGEAKRLISQLTDVTKRGHAASRTDRELAVAKQAIDTMH